MHLIIIIIVLRSFVHSLFNEQKHSLLKVINLLLPLLFLLSILNYCFFFIAYVYLPVYKNHIDGESLYSTNLEIWILLYR